MALSIDDKRRIADYVRKINREVADRNRNSIIVKRTIYSVYVKRIFDIVISIIGLIISIPINLVIAVGTYFDVGLPILFKQDRPGYKGKVFTIVKFRNMTNERGEDGQLLPMDKRVTRFGAFVRRTSLDELLNLWSILKGDMSIIGPRPLAQAYWDRYSNRHKMRHEVKPGLECPIIKGGGRKGWQDQFENDIWYVENVSLLVDLHMLCALIKMVFDRKSRLQYAVSGPSEGDFLGYDENGRAFGENNVPAKYMKILEK